MGITVWIDAQLSPTIARWLRDELGVQAQAVRELSLARADDRVIFDAARKAGAVVMTKDVDFIMLLQRFGPPPQVIWLTCGNTSNLELQQVLASVWSRVQECVQEGQALIEVRGRGQ